jgi:hypothetical protein
VKLNFLSRQWFWLLGDWNYVCHITFGTAELCALETHAEEVLWSALYLFAIVAIFSGNLLLM